MLNARVIKREGEKADWSESMVVSAVSFMVNAHRSHPTSQFVTWPLMQDMKSRVQIKVTLMTLSGLRSQTLEGNSTNLRGSLLRPRVLLHERKNWQK